MCNFDLDYPGAPEELVSKASELVQKAGGQFTGDTDRGTYSLKIPVGSISGEYAISGSRVTFRVTKKPMLVPCSAIESYLKGRLRG